MMYIIQLVHHRKFSISHLLIFPISLVDAKDLVFGWRYEHTKS
jgi:hypothetical protein